MKMACFLHTFTPLTDAHASHLRLAPTLDAVLPSLPYRCFSTYPLAIARNKHCDSILPW